MALWTGYILQNGHNAIFNNNNAMFYSPLQAPLYYHSPF